MKNTRRRRKGSKKMPGSQDFHLAALPLFQYLCGNIRLEYGVMVALQVLVLSVEVRIPVLQLSLQESTSVSRGALFFFVQIAGSVSASGTPLGLIPILGNSFTGISQH